MGSATWRVVREETVAGWDSFVERPGIGWINGPVEG